MSLPPLTPAADQPIQRFALSEQCADAAAFLAVNALEVHFPIRRGLLQRTVGHVRAVDGVSMTISAGRTLALVGESGCGKTTVGKALLQLIKPTAGSVKLGGSELVGMKPKCLRAARRRMQMVFQDPFASLNPRLRVGDIIDAQHRAGADQRIGRHAAANRRDAGEGIG